MEKLLSVDWNLWGRLSLPLIAFSVLGMVILLVSAYSRDRQPPYLMVAVAAVTVVVFLYTWLLWSTVVPLSQGMLLFDRFSYSLDLIVLTVLFLVLLISKKYFPMERIREGESYALLLFAVVGMMLIHHGGDLIVIFLGIEIMSLSSYILTGARRGVIRSYEAAMKYFILGSFASGFLLYGIALAYGVTGSTGLASFQNLSASQDPLLLLLATSFILIGLGFKIAAVPFHLWAPDVYEGAPTPITAFMAAAVKTAAFAALLRVVLSLGHLPQIPWIPILWLLSFLTMTVGNLVALRQTNIKRLLAYSSIAHAGYALVGVTAALQGNALAESTLGAVLFYLFAYSLMTVGAFAIVIAMGHQGDQVEELVDFSGLSEKHPFLAAALTVFLLSLTGIPPTIGFVGKFYLFSGAVESGLYGLVVIGVLNSVVSVYYYFAPIVKMYFYPRKGFEVPPLSYPLLTAIFVCFFLVLYLGVFPSDIFLMARESVKELIF